MSKVVPDYLGSAAKAGDLAQQIKHWWAERGWIVKTRVEKAGDVYVVRSDMVNALPPLRAPGWNPAGDKHRSVLDVKTVPAGSSI
jgi:hypothetical protein